MFLRKNRVAFFDSLSLFVHLDELEKNQLANIEEEGFTPKTINQFKTIHHEQRHYLDVIGTIWGQEYLSKLFNIYHELAHGNMSIKQQVKNLFKTTFLSHYEHLIKISSNYYDAETDWNYKFKIVEEHEDKILMIDCFDESSRLICSTPIFVDSLLEINAIYEEVMIFHYLSKSLDENTRLVEDISMQKDYINNLISDPKFIEYGLCAQLISSYLGFDNLISPFLYGSIISTLVLNLTDEQIIEIPTPKLLLHCNSELDKCKNQHGIAFIKLLGNYVDQYPENKNFTIEKLLLSSNLPDFITFKESVLLNMDNMKKLVPNSNLFKVFYDQHIENGKVVFDERELNGIRNNQLQFFYEYSHIRPFFILGDEYFEIDPNTLPGEDMIEFTKEQWFTLYDTFKRLLNNEDNWI